MVLVGICVTDMSHGEAVKGLKVKIVLNESILSEKETNGKGFASFSFSEKKGAGKLQIGYGGEFYPTIEASFFVNKQDILINLLVSPFGFTFSFEPIEEHKSDQLGCLLPLNSVPFQESRL